MRIVGGRFKGFRFNPPKGFPSRPTTNYAKEALFNILEHKTMIPGARVLDLCAGTGNISFEFISRGAESVTAVDKHFKCIKFINFLAKKFEVEDEIRIVKSDVLRFLLQHMIKYDIIFCDPPFAEGFHEQIVRTIQENGNLTEDGILIIEHGQECSLDHIKGFLELRKYGSVYFSIFEYHT
ncbi:MAG: RsmD family RNA methyltransferase [Crocinitomicaceae bacterium]|nr:RsmD family RNA methyltransferase [Crocinitomicaceae bacterium]